MANEELDQRGYLVGGHLAGDPFGDFEEFNLGSTSVEELVRSGLTVTPPALVNYPFSAYKPPLKPTAAKPDRVYARRIGGSLTAVAVREHKRASGLLDARKVLGAQEQALFGAVSLGAQIAIAQGPNGYIYLDVAACLAERQLVALPERRDLNPAVLGNLLAHDAGQVKDPTVLAERVWQMIWHATKAEPVECLMTFVEIFLLKFLSDNLSAKQLPEDLSFYELVKDEATFEARHGKKAIEHYISATRPRIKVLFPDNTVSRDEDLARAFGLATIVSKTSIINGFAFLKTSEAESLSAYNGIFLEMLRAFKDYGPLTKIDPEFKLRLYETFMRQSARQQKLGQFFTPRNVVKQMVKMAQLGRLPDDAIVFDPACGVGGFVLEPLLFADALPDNYSFKEGRSSRRVKTVGMDIEADLHILAKANLLLHLAEAVRDPATTTEAMSDAMASTFVLMNSDKTLGSLEYPPKSSMDVILTNPPYVTRGSGQFRRHIQSLTGTRNGLDLRDYYEGSGTGLEGFFLRYISGALKPGGRAYVIVPIGMLNRTQQSLKKTILAECNLLASIQLPRNTFFNTPQKTAILVLEKRWTPDDVRPLVMCAIARTIGETTDHLRLESDENDLSDIADAFVEWSDTREAPEATLGEHPRLKVVKFAEPDEFSARYRWDVIRFWTDEEQVALGLQSEATDRLAFIDEAQERIEGILADLAKARHELEDLEQNTETREVSLGGKGVFAIRSGHRITNQHIRDNPGDIPVFSCNKDVETVKGRVARSFLVAQDFAIETKSVATINANGSVGVVFVREPECVVTDDVLIVEAKDDRIDPHFLALRLGDAATAAAVEYEAKLYQARLAELNVEIPVNKNGDFDLERQRAISDATRRFDDARRRLTLIGKWSEKARVA